MIHLRRNDRTAGRGLSILLLVGLLALVCGCSQPEEKASPSPASGAEAGAATAGGNPTERPTGTPVGRPGMAGVPK